MPNMQAPTRPFRPILIVCVAAAVLLAGYLIWTICQGTDIPDPRLDSTADVEDRGSRAVRRTPMSKDGMVLDKSSVPTPTKSDLGVPWCLRDSLTMKPLPLVELLDCRDGRRVLGKTDSSGFVGLVIADRGRPVELVARLGPELGGGELPCHLGAEGSANELLCDVFGRVTVVLQRQSNETNARLSDRGAVWLASWPSLDEAFEVGSDVEFTPSLISQHRSCLLESGRYTTGQNMRVQYYRSLRAIDGCKKAQLISMGREFGGEERLAFDLPFGGEVVVALSLRGAIAIKHKVQMERGREVLVELSIQAKPQFRGVVVDDSGVPLVGARVGLVCRSVLKRGQPPSSTTFATFYPHDGSPARITAKSFQISDEKGRFVISSEFVGETFVYAVAHGHVPASVRVRPQANLKSSELKITLARVPTDVPMSRLFDQKGPLANHKVHLTDLDPQEEFFQFQYQPVTSSEDGYIDLRFLVPGHKYALQLINSRGLSQSKWFTYSHGMEISVSQ